MVNRKIVIASNTENCIHMAPNPSPFIITSLRASINHRAGIIYDIPLSIAGIPSIGNINPDRSIDGSMRPTAEAIIAACCVSVIDDINNPKASAEKVNMILKVIISSILPAIGTLSIK